MGAVAVDVAKAVELEIRRANFEQDFTLERSYAEWELDLSNVDTATMTDAQKLHVDVVSHSTEQTVELVSRGSVVYKVPIDIAVRRKFGLDKQTTDDGRIDIAEIDALMLLVQKLHLLFTPQRLTASDTFPHAVWDGEGGGTKIIVAPIKEHLRDNRQFTGIIRIVFRVSVELDAV